MSFEERKVYEFFLVDVEARFLHGGVKTILTWKSTETGDEVVELYSMTNDKPGKKLTELLTTLNITLDQIRRNMTIYCEVNRTISVNKIEQVGWSLRYCSLTPTCDQSTRSADVIKVEVKRVLAQKLTRSQTLEKLEGLGSEYVKEYRAMQKQSGGST